VHQPRARGLATVGVTWGIGSAGELAAAGAEAIVDRLAELAPVTGELLRAPT
jgi:phosphoglycolate phosphatase-like HAD superfamily hydrolase